MSDTSPEATVAGEAAAAAVEELQSRETVVEAATEAMETAATAEVGAGMAVETATVAESIAVESVEISNVAVGLADQANQNSGIAISETARLQEQISTLESQQREVMELLHKATAPPPAPTVEETVTEVPVNGGEEASNSGDSGSAEGGTTERRNGLRFRRR